MKPSLQHNKQIPPFCWRCLFDGWALLLRDRSRPCLWRGNVPALPCEETTIALQKNCFLAFAGRMLQPI